MTRARRAAGPALVACAALAAVVACTALAALAWRSSGVPPFESVRDGRASSDALLLDRHGAPLHVLRRDPTARRLDWATLDEISPALLDAVLAAEDRRFFAHPGVDPLALAAATADALVAGRARGASTLTMQLAALLEPELRAARGARSLARKLEQMAAALALEARWSKREILEAYLNLVPFRGELEGVTAAARGLFGVEPHGLGAAEALLLAALLRAPAAEPGAVARRACALAARLRAPARCEDATRLARTALAGAPAPRAAVALAPHAARAILRDAGGGARVRSTLDAGIQRSVQAILAEQVAEVAAQNVRDGAALVVENATGEVLAYVGSAGPAASARFVDGVRARRQAGSTLKPLLYAQALDERRLTAASRLLDAPLDVGTEIGVYRPENYDGLYRGHLSVREALAASRNVPAVRVLAMVGVPAFVETLRRLGFEALRSPDHYGDSLALGSADVSLWELVGAYRALAQGGAYTPLRLREVAGPEAPRRAFSPEAAYVVADVLADRAGRASAFGLESVLTTPSWSAVKTGTSVDMRDNWCVGWTRDYSVGVWIGNASGAPMWDVAGVDGAAPAWRAIVRELHRAQPSEPPAPPADLIHLAGEWYLPGSEPAPLRSAATGPPPSRIAAPAEGTLVALDPDVPAARQRLAVRAEPPDGSLAFRLDGDEIGRAGDTILWQPVRGRHALALVDAAGRTLQRVRFEVR